MTMTIDLPIRPGAALNDADTRDFVEQHILNATYSVVLRNSYIPDRAYNKEGIVNILANYAWQEYAYKCGRWQRRPVFEHLPFIPWRSWETVHDTILLTRHATGQGIAEVTGLALKVPPPSGRLLFAGDPHYAGVMSSVVDGERRMAIVGSTRLGHPEFKQTIAARARDLTKGMTPDRTPTVRLFDPPEEYVRHLGPWLADHPEKPRGRSWSGS